MGAVITAVDLIRGIARYAGLKVIEVPGATGYRDTNYEGKADYALGALKKCDFVFVHVEAPDECGHEGDFDGKVRAIEDLDRRLVRRLLEGLRGMGEPFRIMVLADHPTPVTVKTHTPDPAPFVIAGEGVKPNAPDRFDEEAAREGPLVEPGHRLLGLFLTGDRQF